MLVLLLKLGAWRLAWSAVACGVILIVLIAPAFAASPRPGDDDNRNCAVAPVTPAARVTPEADDEADRDGAEQDEDCPPSSPKPSHTPRPTATPKPSPRPTPHHSAKPASCDDNEADDEADDD
jgi:hypothetical protein